MRASAAAGLVFACMALGAAASYLVAAALIHPPYVHVRFAYSQQTFSRPRLINHSGTVLHSIRFLSAGGPVEASWFDSSLMGVKDTEGAYVTLYVDDAAVLSTLRGVLHARTEAAPSTLVWAGSLSSGVHTLTIRMQRVDRGFDTPYVQPGLPGVDSLTVTQYSAG